MFKPSPISIARSAFRAGSLRELRLIKWHGLPHMVACFAEDWRAVWFAARWAYRNPSEFVSKENGHFCVAIPVSETVRFPFQDAGLVCGPSDQWRKWAVRGGVAEFNWVIRSLRKL